MKLFLRESQANKSVDFAELSSRGGKAEHLHFSGRFKGDVFKRIDAMVSTHLLGKEFGGAHLILISPAYILVNETGDDLKYTYNSSYVNPYILEADMFTPLILKSEPGSEIVNKVLYFNCDPKQ
jgi:hypothetical protein